MVAYVTTGCCVWLEDEDGRRTRWDDSVDEPCEVGGGRSKIKVKIYVYSNEV